MPFSDFACFKTEQLRSNFMQKIVIITRKSLVVSINKQSAIVPAAYSDHLCKGRAAGTIWCVLIFLIKGDLTWKRQGLSGKCKDNPVWDNYEVTGISCCLFRIRIGIIWGKYRKEYLMASCLKVYYAVLQSDALCAEDKEQMFMRYHYSRPGTVITRLYWLWGKEGADIRVSEGGRNVYAV